MINLGFCSKSLLPVSIRVHPCCSLRSVYITIHLSACIYALRNSDSPLLLVPSKSIIALESFFCPNTLAGHSESKEGSLEDRSVFQIISCVRGAIQVSAERGASGWNRPSRSMYSGFRSCSRKDSAVRAVRFLTESSERSRASWATLLTIQITNQHSLTHSCRCK